jgi:hypothetical protein
MHWTALAGTQWRTRRTHAAAGPLWTRTLENWLTGYGTSWCGTHRPDGSPGLRDGRDRTRRRSFIYRTRSGLRNNHARRWRPRRSCNRRRNWTRWRNSRRRSCRRGDWRDRCWGWRRDHGRRRHWRTRGCNHWRRRRSRRNCGPLNHGRYHSGTNRRRWRNNGRRGWRNNRRRRLRRRSDHGSGHDWRRWYEPWRRRNRFLLLCDGSQNIARPGDVRQIDFGLNFFFATQNARGFVIGGLRLGRAADICAHLFRLVILD